MLTFERMKPSEWKECAALAARAFYDYEYFAAYVTEDERRHRFLDALLPYAREHGVEVVSLFTNSESNHRFYLKNGFEVFDERRFEHDGRGFGSWSIIQHF